MRNFLSALILLVSLQAFSLAFTSENDVLATDEITFCIDIDVGIEKAISNVALNVANLETQNEQMFHYFFKEEDIITTSVNKEVGIEDNNDILNKIDNIPRIRYYKKTTIKQTLNYSAGGLPDRKS